MGYRTANSTQCTTKGIMLISNTHIEESIELKMDITDLEILTMHIYVGVILYS